LPTNCRPKFLRKTRHSKAAAEEAGVEAEAIAAAARLHRPRRRRQVNRTNFRRDTGVWRVLGAREW
jgi:hypothetical protein